MPMEQSYMAPIRQVAALVLVAGLENWALGSSHQGVIRGLLCNSACANYDRAESVTRCPGPSETHAGARHA